MTYDPGTISFPGLGIDGINPPRTLPFSVFGREIYCYGVVIALGFLLGIYYLSRRARDFGTDFDRITDAFLITVPIAIVCARLYYVAFRWDVYKDDPISACYIWEGGIAIYGGVLGAILGLVIFAKFRKQKLTPYLDLLALGLPIGQSIGRWGNFFNREAYGAEIFDKFFLRMGIANTEGVMHYWHPTFLYESIWNLVGFVLLHFLSRKRRYDGQCFLQYVAWYGLGRVWIEGLRTDSLYLPGTTLRVSQLLAGVSCGVALCVMLYIRLRKKPDGSGMWVHQVAAGTPAAEVSDASKQESTL
ncbi:MAG: prolipoprotein diacylglyceryl transferase [Oscillospiraceae bacterium]|nr:prolipoprotein diacylglyceryl transferase [Oscillospiraceae bacterium]